MPKPILIVSVPYTSSIEIDRIEGISDKVKGWTDNEYHVIVTFTSYEKEPDIKLLSVENAELATIEELQKQVLEFIGNGGTSDTNKPVDSVSDRVGDSGGTSSGI